MNKRKFVANVILRTLIGLALLWMAASAAAQEPLRSGLGDPYYPQAGNPGYDVQHYLIDLVVDVDANYIAGATTIEALALKSMPSFNLDLSGFSVTAVMVNEQPAMFGREGSELIVQPTETITAQQMFTVTVTYEGVPEALQDPAIPWRSAGWMNNDGTVFIAGSPIGSAGWFPGNHYPTDKASYTFNITVPEQFTVAANGVPVERLADDQVVTHVWEETLPMAPHLAAIYIGEFQVESAPESLVPIANYFPATLTPEQRQIFARMPEMVTFYSELIGAYPFTTYGTVVVNDPMFPALENQTLSVFGTNAIHEGAIAHELAHQWFGNSIGLARWQDMWLSEGFATYFQALWVENTEGTGSFTAYMDELYASLEAMPPIRIGDPTVTRLYDIAVYFRGAWTLHALRLEIGDEVFFDIIRQYVATFQHGNATTQDFIDIAEQVSGYSLAAFFDGWLYQETLPAHPSR